MGRASAATPVPVLEVVGIDAGYGDTVVVRGLSLSVPERGVVAVLGPNGAGKTTLLRTISGPAAGAPWAHPAVGP